MNRRLGLFFAPLITLISATSPSGLALYFATSGLVGMLQQRSVLSDDVAEMEQIADEPEPKERVKKPTKNKKKATPKNRPTKKRKR